MAPSLDSLGEAETPSSSSGYSASESLASITERGALMLPEPVPAAAPVALVPVLALDDGAVAAERLRMSAAGVPEASSAARAVNAVPAKLTPRGSLVTLAAGRASPVTGGSTEPHPPSEKIDSGHAVLLRAENAEQQLRQLRMENRALEGEVRKLRADAYFKRIGRSGAAIRDASLDGPKESIPIGSDSADAWAARQLAEERAVKAEAEVLRLHTELQAARIQFALLNQTTAPPPTAKDEVSIHEAEDAYQHCRCMKRSLQPITYILLTVFHCFYNRSPTRHVKMATAQTDMPQPQAEVKNFCVVDRA